MNSKVDNLKHRHQENPEQDMILQGRNTHDSRHRSARAVLAGERGITDRSGGAGIGG